MNDDDDPDAELLSRVGRGEPGAVREMVERKLGRLLALAELPRRQREALVLQYYQELSNIEAAALMGIGVEALESLLSRGRRTLRERLAVEPGRPDDA